MMMIWWDDEIVGKINYFDEIDDEIDEIDEIVDEFIKLITWSHNDA